MLQVCYIAHIITIDRASRCIPNNIHIIQYYNVLSPPRSVFLFIYLFYFNKLWDCPEGGSSNLGLGSIMFIVACELE